MATPVVYISLLYYCQLKNRVTFAITQTFLRAAILMALPDCLIYVRIQIPEEKKRKPGNCIRPIRVYSDKWKTSKQRIV